MAEAVASLSTPIGVLWVAAGARGVRRVHGRPPTASGDGPSPPPPEAGSLLAWAVRELTEYFAGGRRCFTVPVDLEGLGAFARRVLEEVRRLPYGDTATYGGLARRLGCPGAARAVGRALAGNPLPILIPCHRVVRAGGQPGGYSAGLAAGAKEWLLAFERAQAGTRAPSAGTSASQSWMPSSRPRRNSRTK